MKRIFILSLLVLAILSFSSCEEEINLQLDSSAPRLVVNGMISTDTTMHWVTLTQSGDYFNHQPARPISGAFVEISDADSSFLLTESTERPGHYHTPSSYYGKSGVEYRLTIKNVNIEGISADEIFEASSTLPNYVECNSAVVDFSDQYQWWKIIIYAQDPPNETNYYLFSLLNNGKHVTDAYDRMVILDDRYFDGNYADGVWIFGLDPDDGDNLEPGDILTIETYSIDKAYYDYIYGVQTEMAGNNPLFSGSPANVPGNISNGALGCFAACSVSRLSFTNHYSLEEMKNR